MGERKQAVDGSRRAMMAGLGGVAAAAGLAGAAQARSGVEIDRQVADALRDLFRIRPSARQVSHQAFGALVLPDIVKAGFIVGAAYGEGALIVGGKTDSYWSYHAGSVGFQAGAQRTRLALFFLTERSLQRFLKSERVEMGLDAELTVIDGGTDLRIDNLRSERAIVAYVFGRAGLLGGASYSGGRYSRLSL